MIFIKNVYDGESRVFVSELEVSVFKDWKKGVSGVIVGKEIGIEAG